MQTASKWYVSLSGRPYSDKFIERKKSVKSALMMRNMSVSRALDRRALAAAYDWKQCYTVSPLEFGLKSFQLVEEVTVYSDYVVGLDI